MSRRLPGAWILTFRAPATRWRVAPSRPAPCHPDWCLAPGGTSLPPCQLWLAVADVPKVAWRLDLDVPAPYPPRWCLAPGGTSLSPCQLASAVAGCPEGCLAPGSCRSAPQPREWFLPRPGHPDGAWHREGHPGRGADSRQPSRDVPKVAWRLDLAVPRPRHPNGSSRAPATRMVPGTGRDIPVAVPTLASRRGCPEGCLAPGSSESRPATPQCDT